MKQGTVGTYGNESLPNITGAVYSTLHQRVMGWGAASGWYSGSLYGVRKTNPTSTGVYVSSSSSESTGNDGIAVDASRSSSTYQNNAKVNPDNAEILYVIKF